MGFFDEMQKTIFWQNQEGSASAQDMRRKIALAMLMKKSAAPKTFGEGLFSIGDSLADAFTAKDVERKTAEQALQTDKDIATKIPGVSATTGPRAEAVDPLADQVAEAADSPAPGAMAAAPPPAATASAAVAGFRPPPAYLADRLAALVPDPSRRGYLGHLAGGEAKSANEVSPTGAAGPFQFTRGTGAQYGIPGNARFDVDRSIVAANRLTDDNAAVLTKALGRPPSPGELALAHQQGAGTAAKMLTGTGNAPDYNLRVNNAGGLGGQAAAQKIMSYYNMPGSRDSIAATVLNADTPPTPGDMAQETRLGDVTGMRRAPPSFGATASNRTGDVMSDAPPITGALQGPLGASVGDTVQARQDTLAPPQAAPPQQPPGPQIAQAGVFPPVQSAGGQVAPILSGGGLPPFTPPAPQIQQAPPDPRSAIRPLPTVEPYKPSNEPQPEPPVAPGMGPIEAQLTRDILNKDVDERLKAAANARIAVERQQLAIPYNNKMKRYDADIAVWKERQKQDVDYAQKQEHTVLTNEKLRRDMEGEGYTPLSPQDAQKMLPMGGKLPEGQTVWLNRKGEPKFGPTPGTTVNVDTKGATEESKIRGKLAAERENEVIAAGNKSGEELTTIARAEALMNKITTGALEPGRTTIAALGKSVGVSDDFMKSIGLKPEEVGSRQAFQAIVNELTLGRIGPGGMPSNNFSEGDRKFLERTEIGLGDDEESNRIKLASARRKRELHIEKADRWGDYKEANPDKSFSEFERTWNKELKTRNEFGELQTRAEQLIENAKGGPAQKGIPGDLPTATTKIGETVGDGKSKFLRTPEGWTRIK